MKPILFNSAMVRAILDGRKTVTRRVVKPQEPDWKFHGMENDPYMTRIDRNGEEYPSQETGLWATFEWGAGFPLVKAPYQPGQIMYVRETWRKNENPKSTNFGGYEYKVDYEGAICKGLISWRPSIHMPREAARIFLRVTDARVERLQDITEEQSISEGCSGVFVGSGETLGSGWESTPTDEFSKLWDTTIKPADRAHYGWEANPYVWRIEFERCEKPKGD